MDFLQAFLPIIIYILLIVLIVILIVLGIKIIITMNKVEKIVDNVNEKIERVSPLFNIIGYASDHVVGMFDRIFEVVEGLISKIFSKNKESVEMEDDKDE